MIPLRLTIFVLLAVIGVGSIIIGFGFMTNQENTEIEELSPYEKLQTYKEELEKINQYNQKILGELEQKITNSDDEHLEQLNKEIDVLKRVIKDNKAELDQIIQKLSEMNSNP